MRVLLDTHLLLWAQARFEPMILLTDDDVLGGYGDFVEIVS